jgi:hypothetical protein
MMGSLRCLPGGQVKQGQEHMAETAPKIVRVSPLAARCRYAEVFGFYRRYG